LRARVSIRCDRCSRDILPKWEVKATLPQVHWELGRNSKGSASPETNLPPRTRHSQVAPWRSPAAGAQCEAYDAGRHTFDLPAGDDFQAGRANCSSSAMSPISCRLMRGAAARTPPAALEFGVLQVTHIACNVRRHHRLAPGRVTLMSSLSASIHWVTAV